MSVSSIDLSTYVLVARYDLPEPTRTAAPANSLLAQEVSAVTYNWDTGTLFVVGDGGTSVVQVSLTGQLIDSMTLAPGGSPQGTEFYDTEGLTYAGNGKFVMTEERDRQAVEFTYTPDTTLTRSDARTVDLGTFVQNIGLEGVSYDPQTGGFIFVKETLPEGIFQTGIDFAAGTATNGSSTTENSVNLFDPAKANLSDFADVFALSNLPSLNGQADESHLLILSQESGKIVEVDRAGNIYSSLNIVSNAGNPLSVPAQQHEGLTMDHDGNLYVVSENGGGDFDHPQLWVYAPSATPNAAPTAVVLNNQINTVAENTSTATRLKVADLAITDDGLGTNNLTLTGPDAGFFEVDNNGLYIKAGTVLDFETKTSYGVTVNVDDPGLGGTPDATATFTLAVSDVAVETPPVPTLIISEVAPWSSSSPVGADWFEVTNTGSSAVDITGWKMDDSSNSFGSAVALSGITSIGAGESVIFMETANLASARTAFLNTWFGGNAPAGLQIGNYTGSGVGLSTGADAVNLFDSAGTLQANVSFLNSPAGPSLPTFNNAAGLNNTAIAQLSATGVNGGFIAANEANEIGSPGSVGSLFISEVAPWASGNSPAGADWFEVTNTTAFAVDITGWRMDDSSDSFAATVALSGITSIAPGESVIFIEGGTVPAATTIANFTAVWFGDNVPANLQIGTYTGGGVGLSTGGDAVNLYNSSGVRQTGVSFGASPGGPSFPTFDNAAAAKNTVISTLSAVGSNGGFAAINDANEIASPGSIATVVNHAPVVAGVVTLSAIAEDSGARLITQAQLLGNVTDLDGPSLTVANLAIAAGSGTLGDNHNGTWSYTPALNDDTSVSFSYQVTDGTTSVADSATLDITPVNDAPVNTVPASWNATGGTNVAISGVAVSDVDATALTTVLHVDHGTLTVAAGNAAVSGNGTGTLTLTGTAAEINATFAAATHLVYHGAADYAGADSLTVTTSDGGGTGTGGPNTDVDVVSITVAAANHAPNDFNGDGMSDILWRNDNGAASIWMMDNGNVLSGNPLGIVPTDWKIAGTGDFNGDHKADILWHNDNGQTSIWDMDNGNVLSGNSLGLVPTDWKVAGTDDFDGDGKADILWRNDNGQASVWDMDGGHVLSGNPVGFVPTDWHIT